MASNTVLGDIADITSGGTPSKSRPEYWGGSIPWLSAKDMKSLRVDDTEDHITALGADNGTRLAKRGTTLLLTRGMTLLSDVPVCIAGRDLTFNQDVKGLSAKPGVDPEYLAYAVLAAKPALLGMVDLAGHGTGRLPTDRVKALPVWLPTVGEQRAIASIFSALDDKIDLNRRTNETLEAMARALFKSWFVDFDPVRAKAEGRVPFGMDAATAALFPHQLEASSRGKIPRSWRTGGLAELVQFHNSKRWPLSQREREARRGPFRYFGAAGLVDHIDDYRFDGTYALVGEDGSVVHDDGTPFVQYVWGRFWVNNHAHVLTGAGGVSVDHLVLLLRQLDVRPFVTGAVQPKLSMGRLKEVPVVIPPEAVCRAFGTQVAPLFAAHRASVEQATTLGEIRDQLLPKLLSGELRVRDVERAAEQVA